MNAILTEQDVRAGDTSLTDTIGRKAMGLRSVTSDWVPPFVVVTTGAQARWKRIRGQPGWLLSESDFQSLAKTLSSKPGEPHQRVLSSPLENLWIVRSSAIDEDMASRGAYTSIACKPDRTELLSTLDQAWRVAESAGGGRVALIVQRMIQSRAKGHLSNERRVSFRNVDWLLEVEEGESAGESHNLRVEPRTKMSPRSRRLMATNREAVLSSLRLVAHRATKRRERSHFEWVWDGSQVWIVQADTEHTPRGQEPGSEYTTAIPDLPNDLDRIVPWSRAKGNWKKLEALRAFSNSGLVTPPVLVVEGDTLTDISENDRRSETFRELGRILTNRIVIRSETSRPGQGGVFNQALSPSLQNVEVAWEWLTETTKTFLAAGLSTQDFCYFVSPTIVCRASAWALAKPGGDRVRIDAIWGVTDGLQYYPHDSFEVDLAQPTSSSEKIRCKLRYLTTGKDGTWIERETGSPWDWRESLLPAERVEIAKMAQAVADYWAKPIETMFLLFGRPRDRHSTILPWFASEETILEVGESHDVLPRVGHSAQVCTSRDLQTLIEAIGGGRAIHRMVLRPDPELARSKTFVEEVIAVAQKNHLVVELEGSILSHAYYQLRKAGIPVLVRDLLTSGPRVIEYEKLVRDRVPLVIRHEGKRPVIIYAVQEEVLALLKRKAVEEALELLAEPDPESALNEVADLYEVILSVARTLNRTPRDVAEAAEKKRESRGGFEKGIVLRETSEYPLLEPTKELLKRAKRTGPRRLSSPLTPNEIPGPSHQKDRFEIGLPLIPPDSPRAFTFQIRQKGLEVIVNYSGKQARVTIRDTVQRSVERESHPSRTSQRKIL